ncbi:MAG: M20/M25/M40 family metallo-hydrolase [Clostridiaceae bacterium]
MEYIIGGLILFFVIVFVYMTIVNSSFKPKETNTFEEEKIELNINDVVEHLSNSIKFKTIHSANPDFKEFNNFRTYLKNTFPLVYENLEVEEVNNYSLLFHWNGKNKNLKPALLAAHMDVVPIEEGTYEDWDLPPFSGEINDGYLYGRGTLDIKIQVITILETVENLLKQNYVPDRSMYFAFGHDEETDGINGALQIVKLLKERNVSLEYVLDEGGCVTIGSLKGIENPLGVIGIAEKGYANIKLTAYSKGGHSSMPKKHTAAGELATALAKLEKSQPKTRLTKPCKEMLEFIGPYMKGSNKFIISNLNILSPLFKIGFSSSPAGNALLRTTTAITMLEGSNAPNILPQKASAVVNFRILQGESCDDLINHIKTTINNNDIKIEGLRLEEPTIISPIDSFGYNLIAKSAKTVFNQAIITPYLMLAGSDARKYEDLTNCIYRFSPYIIKDDDLKRMHGTNERISIDNIENCLKFYNYIIKNS